MQLRKKKDLDIRMIAPSHGYILRENVQRIIKSMINGAHFATEESLKHAQLADRAFGEIVLTQ